MATQGGMRRSTVVTSGGLLTKEEWRRFDISKTWVAVILLLLIVILWLLRSFATTAPAAPPAQATAPAPTAIAGGAATPAPTAVPTALPAPTNTPVPEPTQAPAPAAPVVDPQNGVIPAGTVTFTGLAAPGAEVDIRVDGVSVGKTKADAKGQWSFDVDLKRGDHEVVVVAADDAGGASAPQTFQIGSGAGPDPVTIASPASGDTVAAGATQLTGTSGPEQDLVITVDGAEVARIKADAQGAWSTDVDLPAGAHNIVVAPVAADGTVFDGAASTPLDVTAETQLAKPAITSPVAGNVTSGNVVLRGTAAPNQTIEIVVDGAVVGTTTSDARGNWFLSAPLTAGARSVVARYAGASGASGSSDAIAYSVQQRRPGGQCRNTTPIPADVSRYTVVENDTLFCISQRSGLSIAAIKRDNAFITDENLILPGQVLILREHVPPTPTPAP